MKKLGLKIAGWTALLYCGLLLITLAFETSAAGQHTTISLYRDYPRSIYANTAHYAVYGMDRLDDHPRQVFILGASVPGQAFDPELLMEELPGYKVHNLSVSGSNITQMEQVIDLLSTQVDWRTLDSAIFVFGGHFVSFLENERKFGGMTKIETEELRHHLYRLEDGNAHPVLHGPLMNAALFMAKPFAFLYKLKFESTGAFNDAKIALVGMVRKTVQEVPPSDAAYYRAFREKQFRSEPLLDEQFDRFHALAARLKAGGARVVFADMPVPGYFRDDFFAYTDYQKKVKRISRDKTVHYLDLTDFAPDSQFLDDSHPRPEFAARWSAALAEYLLK
ncbi:MAG TPA: hypothetical protein VIG74_05015, partial [Alphaproteobacteria bacterium]